MKVTGVTIGSLNRMVKLGIITEDEARAILTKAGLL